MLRQLLPDEANSQKTFRVWYYFRQRPAPVGFTRSRPYRKNDNAHVERKNWTHLRQLVGYVRLEGPTAAALLDDLYRHEWGWLRNFYCPVMKHLRTEVIGSRKKRIYDQPATPFQRLKACGQVSRRQLAPLQKLFDTLDPFELTCFSRNSKGARARRKRN